MAHGTPPIKFSLILGLLLCLTGPKVLATDDVFDALTFDLITNMALSADPINGSANAQNQLPSGRVLAFQTNEGRYGKLRITSYGRDLTVKWVTYRSNGRIHSQGAGLTIRGTYSCDLDAGREGRDSADFFWRQATSTERYLVPRNGARFALHRELGSVEQPMGLGEFVAIVKQIYDIAKQAKSFYDTYISGKLSAEQTRFLALIEEMNDLYLRELLRQAWGTIDYFSLTMSIDPDRDDYREQLHNQLAHVAELGVQARRGLNAEIARQPPSRAVKLVEAHALITPILGATGVEIGWDAGLVNDFYVEASASHLVMLGPQYTNHENLPFYSANRGKLDQAYRDRYIDFEEYNWLRSILWNSEEFAKQARGVPYKQAYWIRTHVHIDDTHYYNRCLTRIGQQVKATPCKLSEGTNQIWSFDIREDGHIKIRFLNSCMTRTHRVFAGVVPTVEPCSDSGNQLWEWIGYNIVAPTSAETINDRQFLYVMKNGTVRMRPEELPYTPEDFPNFQVIHKDEPRDHLTDFVGFRKRAVIGSDVPYESRQFRCPLGMAAQGVIAADRLNNFGLICTPTRRDWRRRPTVEEQLASAMVISYGTTQVNHYTTDTHGDPFWYFLDGMRSGRLAGGTPVNHYFQLCPPGYFVRSITPHFAPPGYVFGLEGMICVSPSGTSRQALAEGTYGTRVPASDPWYFRRETACPAHDTVFTGIEVYRTPGTKIGGFQAGCFQTPNIVSSLIGDRDQFGINLREGGRRVASLGGFDAREPTDPHFTDVLGQGVSTFTYRHTYSVAGRGDIRSAQLTLMALGVQDGDTNVTGSNTDIRLYLDGVEIPRAFDKVDQFSLKDSAWGQSAGQITITLPDSVLSELADGEVEVRIDNAQHGTGGLDSYAIDFSELLLATGK